MSLFKSGFLLFPILTYLTIIIGAGVLCYWIYKALKQFVVVNELKEELLRIELDEKRNREV